jgi:hypothetical protein
MTSRLGQGATSDTSTCLRVTLDEGPRSRDQWIQTILLVESFKLVPRPLDKGPWPKKWQIEAKPTWHLFWRENHLVQHYFWEVKLSFVMAPPFFRNHNNTSAKLCLSWMPQKPWKKFGPIVMVVSKISHQQKSSHFFQAIPNFRFFHVTNFLYTIHHKNLHHTMIRNSQIHSSF